MHKKVKFHQNQQGVFSDHNDAQNHAGQTFDHLIYDAVTTQRRFSGCLVEKTAATTVSVAPGRLYVEGLMYTHEDVNYEIDFFSGLPLSTEKIVAIVLAGSPVETEDEQRKFLTDATTRATQVQTVPTTIHRAVTISEIAGTEAATPAKPTVSSDLVTIAWVTLDTTGVKSIEMNAAAALESIQNNDIRLTDIEDWRVQVGNRLNTLATDISSLVDSQVGTANNGVVAQLAADVARLKEFAELESGYTDYGADRFLDEDQSDTDDVNYLARIEEGVRFSKDAEDEFALEIFNPIDPNVIISNGFLLPKYTNLRRLTVEGFQEELQISQYAFQAVDYRKRTIARERIRYGEDKVICENSAWFKSGEYDSAERVLKKDGDTWEVVAVVRNVHPGIPGHKYLRLRKFWYDRWEEVYWDKITTDHQINGSVISQTFLNSQVGWMTALHLYFHQVGPSGDVNILLCRTDAGKPDVNNVIGSVTLSHDDMVVGWNEIAWPATLLEPGLRYGIILVTGGNHYVGLANGTRYAQGTLFYSTDGAFYQGDLTKDLMFAIDCAEFTATRIEVEMDALSLSGGISDIDLLAQVARPDGTSLSWEIQPGGSGAWIPLNAVDSGNTVLYGLPALCKFRAVFNGSTDAHAGINLTTSLMNISRPRTTFLHISESVTLQSATQSIKISVLLENFYETNHDLTCAIDDVTNAATGIAPATVTDVDLGVDTDGNDANHKRIRRTFEWTATELTSATSEIIIKLTGATSSALDTFLINERVHLGF